jgi:hypothetical protein
MDRMVQVEPMGGLLHRIDGNQSAGQVQQQVVQHWSTPEGSGSPRPDTEVK